MSEALAFVCSICGESSTQICVYCTKDACSNHCCERCRRCSDCCECELRLDDPGNKYPEPGIQHRANDVQAEVEVPEVHETHEDLPALLDGETTVPDDQAYMPDREPPPRAGESQ